MVYSLIPVPVIREDSGAISNNFKKQKTMTKNHDKELNVKINGISQAEFLAKTILEIERGEMELQTAKVQNEFFKQLNNRGKLLIHRARIDIDERKIALAERKQDMLEKENENE